MHQSPRHTAFARDLRRNATDAERLLWNALRERRLLGLKCRRQVPLGPYIADFYCAELRLIVEADSGQHGTARDLRRDTALTAAGFTLLRFWNIDILTNLPGVLQSIADRAKGGFA